MKKALLWTGGVIVALVLVYFCLPYYARQALIHLMPKINDLEIFYSNPVPTNTYPAQQSREHIIIRLFQPEKSMAFCMVISFFLRSANVRPYPVRHA